MALSFRVYGTLETTPSIDELVEALEEGDFEATIEAEDLEDDDEEWEEIFVYESSLDEPVEVIRHVDGDTLDRELEAIQKSLADVPKSDELKDVRHTLENCVVIYEVELAEEYAEDDNAVLLCMLLAQTLAQKSDGIFCVDAEGFFNDTGDLIFEMAADD